MKSLSKVAASTAAVGVICAAALSPAAGVGAVAVTRTQATMQSNLKDLTGGDSPGVTTILDAARQPIAWIYDQRRYPVGADQISPLMKAAIVSVEDRRFYFHDGVDWQGTLRAMITNTVSGSVQQGASTLDQQYVKNYLLLVDAKDQAEQAAATETSYARKLREMKMASDLEKHLSKDEILTRYLNIVPFGNGAFGVEAAAQTYFGIPAAELNLPQAAMLAGIVQSSSVLNPYTNEAGVIERRNTVLDTMVASEAISAQEAAAAKAAPLGVLEQPGDLPNGCIAAGNRGYFCDYVLQYLAGKGFDQEKLKASSYTITTTLDPALQEIAHNAVTAQANPQAPGVAAVLDIVQPGPDSRKVLAMTYSRDYGLDAEAHQSVLALPYTQHGSGAGSIFKLFTAAVALEKGMGTEQMLPVPARVEVKNMGAGGAANCPPDTYCVENAGVYKPEMTLADALAHSPNTTFVKLIEQVGVADTVQMAIRLGLTDFTLPGSFNGQDSVADYVTANNLGSFTLGPTGVNPLQLSNVAATLASHGVWCEPNPIEEMLDASGRAVTLPQPACTQAVAPELADSLAQAMSHDTTEGTAADSARAFGWGTPTAAKTGTTEAHSSAAFLGFNSNFAAAPYVFNDGVEVLPLCTSPLRQCANGDLYGGMEPSRIWFGAATAIEQARTGGLAPAAEKYQRGITAADLPRVDGLTEADARTRLEDAGFLVTAQTVPGNGIPKNRAVRAVPKGPYLLKGDAVYLQISDGSKQVTPPPVTTAPATIDTRQNPYGEQQFDQFGNPQNPPQQPQQPTTPPNTTGGTQDDLITLEDVINGILNN
ncbi:Penicillin-binding protein 1A [Corynebacterium choanae]|uniref:Penicillin-binding protein 1A n=1 Tax=Corynebacterium choanae TaxID=1862358 RepID=A0A3G6J8X8_9CORY|nr:transglycosylase domain-containing protein [Corynebacterium choanae]AZA14575.1 Penicillin-binding protein 1A [Corynebacterium choanae]